MSTPIEVWQYIIANIGLGSLFVFFLCLGVTVLGIRECYSESTRRREIVNYLARFKLRRKAHQATLPMRTLPEQVIDDPRMI